MSPSTELDPEVLQRNILIVSTTLTGLMILEYVWNIRFEKRIIWPQLRKSNDVKLFVISRYVGLVAQISNVFFSRRMASGIPIHPLVCRVWFGYQAVIVETITMSAEALLMLLVYRLCNKHRSVVCILLVFVGMQCSAMAVSARLVVPNVGSSSTCMIVTFHAGQIYLGASTIAVHLCLLAIILWRYLRGNWPEPLDLFLKGTVRYCTVLVIVVSGNYLVVVLLGMGFALSLTGSNAAFHALIFSFYLAVGQLVLHRERFLHEHNLDLTLLDLDITGSFADTDIAWPAEPSSKVPAEVRSVPIDPELDVGTKDITDECLSDWAEDKLPSSHTSTILHLESGNNDSDG